MYRENRTKHCVRSNGYSLGCFLRKRGTWQGDPKCILFKCLPLTKTLLIIIGFCSIAICSYSKTIGSDFENNRREVQTMDLHQWIFKNEDHRATRSREQRISSHESSVNSHIMFQKIKKIKICFSNIKAFFTTFIFFKNKKIFLKVDKTK